MNIKPEEITAILEKEIENLDWKVNVKEVGYVLQVGDGIARVYGLENVMAGEMVKFSETVFGMVFNLEENNVGCVILGDADTVKEGDVVERTNKVMSIPVGENMLGRVVDPLGNPIDGAGEIQTTGTRPVERIAPGVCDRQPVTEPLQTGY